MVDGFILIQILWSCLSEVAVPHYANEECCLLCFCVPALVSPLSPDRRSSLAEGKNWRGGNDCWADDVCGYNVVSTEPLCNNVTNIWKFYVIFV